MFQRYFLASLAALLTLATAPPSALAQTGGVGIGTTAPDASAVLEIRSTSKGLLPPRLTQAQRDAIASPAAGLTVFNTTTSVLNVWDGTRWVPLLADSTPTLATASFGPSTSAQTYTVPSGVTRVLVDLAGAKGRDGLSSSGRYLGSTGGKGGRVQATLAVTPGETLTLYVGSGGSGGDGGNTITMSGGGGTDLRQLVGGSLSRVLVAGGGGGGGSGYYAGPGIDLEGDGYNGGAGGWPAGGDGSGGGFAAGGTGGSQTSAGSGGANGYAGTGGTGGKGGDMRVSAISYGGGGGGGYYGGGGGGNAGRGAAAAAAPATPGPTPSPSPSPRATRAGMPTPRSRPCPPPRPRCSMPPTSPTRPGPAAARWYTPPC